MEVGRALGGIADPHGHVDEEEVAQASFVEPSAGDPCRGGEAVVEIDAEAASGPARGGDHRLGLIDLVADRLFAEDMASGLEGLEGRLAVVAAIFEAPCGDAGDVGPEGGEHLGGIEETGDAMGLGGGSGSLLDEVADAHELGVGILPV